MRPAEEVGHRRAAALVGDVDHVDAGALLEELAGEMSRAAHARRRIVDLAGLLLRERDEFGERLRRHARMHDHHVGKHDAHRDRRDVALRIVRRDPSRDAERRLIGPTEVRWIV